MSIRFAAATSAPSRRTAAARHVIRAGATLATAAALALAGGCLGRAPSLPPGTPIQAVGTWRIGIATAPDPPRTGENRMTVVARDSAGHPLRGEVSVVVSMPAMGAMPYMESRAVGRAAGAGAFRATYGLPMQGEWDVVVTLRPEQGTPAEARYRLSTSVRGLAFAGGAAGSGTSEASLLAPDTSGDVVALDPARRQALGIRVAPVEVRDLDVILRAPGRVVFEESHQAEVSLRFNGWVRTLVAGVTGQPVRRGGVLFTVYSPELWSAEREYLDALRAARADAADAELAASSRELARAARERLLLWDIAPQDVDALARAGQARGELPVRSPVSGVITEKNVVQGSAFMAGQVLFKVARLDPVWVIASVPQSDLALVRTGMAANLIDPATPGGVRHGLVQFVYPALDSTTRTGEVRIVAPNPGSGGGALRPGTFITVELATPLLRRLAVPEEAVIPTGERQLVFVDLGDGRLAARDIRIGRHAGAWYEVLAGLSPGERVVTSGNFLVAAEARLRSATGKW